MKKERRKLIINLDDVGSHDGSVLAAKKLLQEGTIKGASVIVPGAASEEFLQWAAMRPELDIGIHSTVTCEWNRHRWKPLGKVENIRSFTAEDDCMIRGSEEEIQNIHPEDYTKETETQIEQMIIAGCKPGHLDNHMWTIRASERMLENYLWIAEKYELLPHIPEWLLFSTERKKLVSRSGWPVIQGEWFITGTESEEYAQKKKKLKELLLHLPEGIQVLTVHASTDTKTGREMIPKLRDRVEEYQILLDEEIQEILHGMEDILTSFQQIKEEEKIEK